MPHLLVISKQHEDLQLGKSIAFSNSFQYHEASNSLEIQNLLIRIPEVMVIWDADTLDPTSATVGTLARHVPPSRNIAITAETLGSYPHLLKYPFFGHHVQRRYPESAVHFYTKMVAACMHIKAEGLMPFFSPETRVQRLDIRKPSHKMAAIEALEKTLTNRGIRGRVSTLIAQCTDELLLNAMFDAPMTPDRLRFRHRYSRAMDFEMTSQERVYVEMAASENYMGISVTDAFGSLNRVNVFNSLRSYFMKDAKMGDALSGPASGFGLQGILRSGVSLKIYCQAGQKTEAMIFFPITDSVRDFRKSFRFFSLIAGE